MQRQRTWLPWLAAILTVSLLFAALLLVSNYQYIGNDDSPILRSFMGYDGGEPATFHLYLHTAFAWLLWALAKVFPGVAWFSVLQLVLLCLSQVFIVKSLAQLSQRRGFTIWPGILAGVLLLAGHFLYITVRISYTTTAALAGAAAVAQLLSIDFTADRKRGTILALLASTALLLCAYGLRQLSVLPALCFWLLALVIKLLCTFGRTKRPWAHATPVWIGLAISALLFGIAAGVRALDIRLNKAEDFLKWQNERIQLLDYTDFATTTTAETLQTAGWSESEFGLVTYWYFLDDTISTEAFAALNAQQQADDATITLAARAIPALGSIHTAFQAEPSTHYVIWMLLLMALAALLAAFAKRRLFSFHSLGILLALLGGFLLLWYLAYSGRLPMRAIASVTFPMAVYLYCAVFGCPAAADAAAGAPAKATRWPLLPAALALGMCLWAAVMSVCAVSPSLAPPPPLDEEVYSDTTNRIDLDNLALENPDKLIIYDLSLATDERLFPDTSQGIPTNLMFWGGYPARSPSWYRILANFGITELSPSLYLREDVLLASTDPEPWTLMMDYLSESLDTRMDWAYYGSYGYVNLFQFSEY